MADKKEKYVFRCLVGRDMILKPKDGKGGRKKFDFTDGKCTVHSKEDRDILQKYCKTLAKLEEPQKGSFKKISSDQKNELEVD